MTISSAATRKAGPYSCNGSLTNFAFTFKIFATSDVLVTLTNTSTGAESTLTLTTHYSVTMNGDQDTNPGGSIATVATYASGYTITIGSQVPETQTTDIPNLSAFYASIIESALDKLNALIQQASEKLSRSIKTSRADSTALIDLPIASERASSYLAFDASGQPFAAAFSDASAPVSTFMETVLDDTTAAAARTTLGVIGLPDFFPSEPFNVSLSASVAANALTITLKGHDGNDHSATNPGYIPFRSATETDGDQSVVALTSAKSITIPSGATMGAVNNRAFRLWVVAFNNAGSVVLGVMNPFNLGSALPMITPLYSGLVASGTLIDTASDNPGTLYSSESTGGAKAITVLGYVTYESGLATVGTWNTAPTTVQSMISGLPLPGTVIGRWLHARVDVVTGTTQLPVDDTIPQGTEGDEYFSVDFSAKYTSKANAAHIRHIGEYASSNTDNLIVAALFTSAGGDALAVQVGARAASANTRTQIKLEYMNVIGAITSQYVKIRAGTASAGTTTLNGSGGTRNFGGTAYSFLLVEEIMA